MLNRIKKYFIFLVLALVIASIVFYIIYGLFAVISKVLIILAFAGIIAYGVLYYHEIIRFFQKAGSVTGVTKVVQFLVIAAILIFIYLLSDTIPWKLDLTSTQLYSLTPETKSIIQSVTNDMNVYFFKPESASGGGMDYIDSLLKAYSGKNSHIKIHNVDPYQNRTLAIDNNVTEDVMVVFEYQGNKAALSVPKILEADNQNGRIIYKGEQAFTGAMKSLILSKPENILVLSGHGEINPQDNGSHGLKAIFEKIQQDNVKLAALNLLTFPDVPADCNLLIIGNPVQSLSIDEMDKITRYLDQGGNILVLLEYETHITVNDILRQMGLYYYPNLAVESEDYNPQLGRTIIHPEILPGEITDPLIKNKMQVIMPTSVGILALDVKDRVNGEYQITPLVRTSKNSFGEVSKDEISTGKVTEDPKDIKGPLTVGWAVDRFKEDEESNRVESRLVVFGDSDFVNNTYANQYANSDLFLNAVNYLLKREANITIQPKTSAVRDFQLSTAFKRFLTVFAFAVFILYLIPGIVIIVRRRSKVKG